MKKFFNLFLLGIFLLLCFAGCEIDGQPPIDPAELTPTISIPVSTPNPLTKIITMNWNEPGNYTWDPPTNIANNIITIVGTAGGGGGGGGFYASNSSSYISGEGGKAGAYIEREIQIDQNTTYTINVGSGGDSGIDGRAAGMSSSGSKSSPGNNGGNTTFSTIKNGIVFEAKGGAGGENSDNQIGNHANSQGQFSNNPKHFGDGGNGGPDAESGEGGQFIITYQAYVE